MSFKIKTLKSGLRVLVVPVKDAPSMTVMSMVATGSEYETKDKNGISHFLEHMFFKGTKNRPKSIDISREFDEIGAEHNAFTSNEVTAYYGKASRNHFDKMLSVISDMYTNPTFPEGDMEIEKGVIIEEINMYEDQPQSQVRRVFRELMYGDTPFGWSILGPIENIKKMKREDLLDYRKSHYIASRTLVVVSGDVRPADVFKKTEKAFSGILTGKVLKKIKFTQNQKGPKIEIKHRDSDQLHLIIGVRTFGLHDKRLPVLRVLSSVLDGGMSARLFQKMREELGICYYIRSGESSSTDHGHFSVSAGVDKSRLNEAIAGIMEELKKITLEKVPAQELKKAKDYLVGQMYLGLESSDSLAGFYGFQEIMKEKIKTPKELEKAIQNVTAEDIQKLTKQIFIDKNLNMAIVGNVKEGGNLTKLLHF